MNVAYGEIARFLSRYLFGFSSILLLPLFFALFFTAGEHHAAAAFLATLMFTLLIAAALAFYAHDKRGTLQRRESLILVAFVWLSTSMIAALPFILSGALSNYLDALFEAVSGLTTTGATILYPMSIDSGKEVAVLLTDPLSPHITYSFFGNTLGGGEAIGKTLLLWRAMLQWVGGMGIIVLALAVLPALAIGGRFLFEAEVSGITKEGLTPRIKETASLLWRIYLGLTILQIILLIIVSPEMPLFEAVTLSFSTISTGGFSTSMSSIRNYGSGGVLSIVGIFMVLGSINFTLYFHVLKGKLYRLYDKELFAYFALLAFSALFVAATMWNHGVSIHDALSNGTFQAISAETTTGFPFTPPFSFGLPTQLLMLFLTFIGGMSGSTTGGIKTARLFILFRILRQRLEAIFRPYAVHTLRLGDREVSEKVAATVLLFLTAWGSLVALGTLLLVLDGIAPFTAFGSIASLLNNAGLPMGQPELGSFAFLPPFSKIVGIFWMLLGRFECFALLALFLPSLWRGK